MNEFGKKIKEIRKNKHITQKKLSELTGIAEITIRQYEAGKYAPKFDKVRLIAKALNVTIDTLLDSTDDVIEYLDCVSKEYEQQSIESMKSQKVYDICQRIEKIGFPIDISNHNRNYYLFIGKYNKHDDCVELTSQELLALEKDSNDYLKFKLNELIKQKTPNSNE